MYRSVSLLLSVSFALVGLLFLFFPGGVTALFNGLSPTLNLPVSPADPPGLFRVLAVGYMYLVAALAYLMYRRPSERFFPALLISGKLTTALISLALFLTDGRYLIYMANGVVDGVIALALVFAYLHFRRNLQRTRS